MRPAPASAAHRRPQCSRPRPRPRSARRRRAQSSPRFPRRNRADAPAVRRGHVGVVRGDDRRGDRPAGRQPVLRRDAQRPDLDDQHRRLHVEHASSPSGSGSSATREAVERGSRRRSRTLETMERHVASGQFYNWYDHRNGAKLTAWPPTGDPLTPILSSVDNGWLATGLQVVAEQRARGLATRAGALFDTHGLRLLLPAGRQPDRRSTYAPDTGDVALLLRHDRQREPDRELHRHRQGRAAAEGLLRRLADVPRRPATGTGTRRSRSASTRPTSASNVFEGAYPYDGFRVVRRLGRQHVRGADAGAVRARGAAGARAAGGSTTRSRSTAQIHHGLDEAEYGYWGFSPANIPEGGYGEYGVDALGMDPDGYTSNEDNTLVDRGFGGCPGRAPQPDPPPSAYTNGVVTPHAAFLACAARPTRRCRTSRTSSDDFPASTATGASATRSTSTRGTVSDAYLSLDQGIVMAAIGNALARRRPARRVRHEGGPQGTPPGDRAGDVRRRSARRRRSVLTAP